jgi:pimeloyl-ACP methyl ester carboxylesterase
MQDVIVHNLHLMSALRLDKPHLVGHSMGGWMAAEMAVLAGERFNRLVLNAPAGLNHPDHLATDLSRVTPQELPGYLAHRVDVALRYFPGGSDAPAPEEFVAAREKEGAALGNILKVHGFGHPNLGRWLSRIPNETLILWGDKDRMMPASQADVWAKRIPKARVHIVRDVGHFSLQEDPTSVKVIGDFLAA